MNLTHILLTPGQILPGHPIISFQWLHVAETDEFAVGFFGLALVFALAVGLGVWATVSARPNWPESAINPGSEQFRQASAYSSSVLPPVEEPEKDEAGGGGRAPGADALALDEQSLLDSVPGPFGRSINANGAFEAPTWSWRDAKSLRRQDSSVARPLRSPMSNAGFDDDPYTTSSSLSSTSSSAAGADTSRSLLSKNNSEQEEAPNYGVMLPTVIDLLCVVILFDVGSKLLAGLVAALAVPNIPELMPNVFINSSSFVVPALLAVLLGLLALGSVNLKKRARPAPGFLAAMHMAGDERVLYAGAYRGPAVVGMARALLAAERPGRWSITVADPWYSEHMPSGPEWLRENCRRARLPARRIRVRAGDVRNRREFADDSFDYYVLFTRELYDPARDLPSVINEAIRVLAPGGVLATGYVRGPFGGANPLGDALRSELGWEPFASDTRWSLPLPFAREFWRVPSVKPQPLPAVAPRPLSLDGPRNYVSWAPFLVGLVYAAVVLGYAALNYFVLWPFFDFPADLPPKTRARWNVYFAGNLTTLISASAFSVYFLRRAMAGLMVPMRWAMQSAASPSLAFRVAADHDEPALAPGAGVLHADDFDEEMALLGEPPGTFGGPGGQPATGRGRASSDVVVRQVHDAIPGPIGPRIRPPVPNALVVLVKHLVGVVLVAFTIHALLFVPGLLFAEFAKSWPPGLVGTLTYAIPILLAHLMYKLINFVRTRRQRAEFQAELAAIAVERHQQNFIA